MTSPGAMTFPFDLLIASPLPSTTNPWVRTPRYGAACLVPTAASSVEWNHPRCWSDPSRYRSTGVPRFSFPSQTHAYETPESNHTSRMSVSFRNSFPPQAGQEVPGGSRSLTSRSNQASAPSFSNISATWSMSFRSSRYSSHPAHWKIAIGTPHDLWREMHQSGRLAIIPSIRSWPQEGIHRTFRISESAFARRPVLSIEMNHCLVARKMTGCLHRQQCG